MDTVQKIQLGLLLAVIGSVGSCTFNQIKTAQEADATDPNCYRRLELISRKDKAVAMEVAEDGRLTVWECGNDIEPRMNELVEDYQNRDQRRRVLAVKESVK